MIKKLTGLEFIDELSQMSKDEILKLCEERGVTGCRRSTNSCLLSNLVFEVTGERFLFCYWSIIRKHDLLANCNVPPHLEQLMKEFDESRLPSEFYYNMF